jgi:hypothetical protein
MGMRNLQLRVLDGKWLCVDCYEKVGFQRNWSEMSRIRIAWNCTLLLFWSWTHKPLTFVAVFICSHYSKPKLHTYIPGFVGWLFDWFVDGLAGLLYLVSDGFCCFGSEWVEVGLFVVVWECLLWYESVWFCLSRIFAVIFRSKGSCLCWPVTVRNSIIVSRCRCR